MFILLEEIPSKLFVTQPIKLTTVADRQIIQLYNIIDINLYLMFYKEKCKDICYHHHVFVKINIHSEVTKNM